MAENKLINRILGAALIVSGLGFLITGTLHTVLMVGAGAYLILKK